MKKPAHGLTLMFSVVPCFAYRCLDRVRVKGKLEPVRIYEPVGAADALDAATRHELMEWEAFLAAYYGQRWDEAAHVLGALRQAGDSKLYQVYAERIAQFRLAPPPADWDGVYTYTTK